MNKDFKVGEKVSHDLRVNGWPFVPEVVTIVAAHQNGRYDVKKDNGNILKGIRSSVLFAIEKGE